MRYTVVLFCSDLWISEYCFLLCCLGYLVAHCMNTFAQFSAGLSEKAHREGSEWLQLPTFWGSGYLKKCRSVCPINLFFQPQPDPSWVLHWRPPACSQERLWLGRARPATMGQGHVEMPPWDTSPHGPQLLATQRGTCICPPSLSPCCTPSVNCCLSLHRSALCQQTPPASISSTQTHPQASRKSLFAHLPLVSMPRGRRNGKNIRYPHPSEYPHSANLPLLGNTSTEIVYPGN